MKKTWLVFGFFLFAKAAFGQVDSLRLLPPEKSKMTKVVDSLGIEHFEMMPQFPGGEAALFQFVVDNIRYPKTARENGNEGRVVVSFVVEKDGSITEPKIMKSVGGGCDEESLRVVGLMPKWHPGWHNDRPVRVKFNMPFVFKLEGGRKRKRSKN